MIHEITPLLIFAMRLPASAPPLAAIITGLAIVVGSSGPPRKPEGRDSALLLPRKEFIQVFSAPLRELAVDMLWINMLVKITVADSAVESLDIYRYAELITSLEPRFRPVYLFAGVMTPWRNPDGTHSNTVEAIAILERGILYFPDHTYLRLMLAHHLLNYRNDKPAAAKVLAEAMRYPGTSPWLGQLARKLVAGNPEAEADVTISALGNPDPDSTEAVRKRTATALREAWTEKIQRAIERFRADKGFYAKTVEELVAAGYLPEVPEDPLGGRYVLGLGGQVEIQERDSKDP